MDDPIRLSSSDIEMIKFSFHKIQGDPFLIRNMFYQKVFDIAPEVRNLFRDSFLSWEALPDSIQFMYKHVDNLEESIPEIKKMGLKHKTYGVKKSHYPIVQTALLWSLKRYLGEEFTQDVKVSWSKLFEYMTHFMILGSKRK